MSEQTTATAEAQAPETPAKKTWTRKNSVKFVTVSLALPFIFEDYEPWVFKLRFKLSEDGEKKRQQYAVLPPAKKLAQAEQRNLDEICDLLVELPKGFGDLVEVGGQSPGETFRQYVKNTSDPQERAVLMQIINGALDLYWQKISPLEFRTQISDSVS